MKKFAIFSNILELKIAIRFILVRELLLSYTICYALYEINVCKFSMVLSNNVCHEFSPRLGSTSKTQDASSASLGSDVPAPLKNAAVGGKASLQPERTPVTAREINAILVSKTLHYLKCNRVWMFVILHL